MKRLKDFITEKQNFLIKNKNVLKDYDHYEYHPKTQTELRDIIIKLLEQGQTDLNCIDVSEIKDMRYMFYGINRKITIKEIDVSEWNVSNVKYMNNMFDGCNNFNSDLSNWDVSNVIDMSYMFNECKKFNSDLSKWNVSNVIDMYKMFIGCEEFNSDITRWDVSKVTDMDFMFFHCHNFNYNLSNWNVTTLNIKSMFKNCATLKKNNNIPKWYSN